RSADPGRVAIERGHDVEALPLEAAVEHEGRAEVAHAHHAHAPAPVEPQDRADLLAQVGDVVAEAAAAERAEAGEVLADLGRGDAFTLGEAVRGDELAALGLDLFQHPVVVRESPHGRLGDTRHDRYARPPFAPDRRLTPPWRARDLWGMFSQPSAPAGFRAPPGRNPAGSGAPGGAHDRPRPSRRALLGGRLLGRRSAARIATLAVADRAVLLPHHARHRRHRIRE